MLPVSVLAALVAMAGPQRMAAESSLHEAAQDIARFAAEGQEVVDDHMSRLSVFNVLGSLYPPVPPDCVFTDRAERLPKNFYKKVRERRQYSDAGHEEMRAAFNHLVERCELLTNELARDLGPLGINVDALRGYFIDYDGRNRQREMEPVCTISDFYEVGEVFRVALVVDWQDAGWAAAQVWPDGIRISAHSVGTTVDDTTSPRSPTVGDCEDAVLNAVDSRGRPVQPDPSADPWEQSDRIKEPLRCVDSSGTTYTTTCPKDWLNLP